MTVVEPLILYSRVDCHLCDQAVLMLDELGLPWQPVDIDTDAELASRYGLTVPVVRNPQNGRELAFPFSLEDLATAFLGGGLGRP